MAEERDFWQDFKRKEMMKTLLKNVKTVRDLIDGDGHSIYKSEYLIQQGFPEDMIKRLEETYTSDFSSAKSTIFDGNGNIVESLTGVYALRLHYEVAYYLLLEAGVDYNDTLLGRGFQAQELARAIKKEVGLIDA